MKNLALKSPLQSISLIINHRKTIFMLLSQTNQLKSKPQINQKIKKPGL